MIATGRESLDRCARLIGEEALRRRNRIGERHGQTLRRGRGERELRVVGAGGVVAAGEQCAGDQR